mmetsp:Transcript_2641/g.8503  ORF Transcript_2641/g.8503 Transcript_2641/m.8503 type:complete len:210 (-) Transcript_2641:85-714(-)
MAGALLHGEPSAERLAAAERDAFRLGRLRQNLRLYLPDRALARVRVRGGDSSSPWSPAGDGGPYDAILVDAPCSSERERLLRAASRAREAPNDVPWDAVRAHANAERQIALLSTALELAPCGVVVYATCALSRIENDGVVARVLRRAPGWRCCGGTGDVGMAPWAPEALFDGEGSVGFSAEETTHGWRALPDRGGWGPIYWAVLRGPGA